MQDEMGTTQGGFTYDNGGRLTQITRPGSYIAYQYNARDWLTAVLNRTSGGVTCYDANYYYNDGSLWDFVGNPLKRVENTSGSIRTTTLRYDALSRQTQESRTPSPYSLYYTYDAVGNRASRNYNGTTVTYSYDTNNKLTSANDGSSFGYDNNGNMTSVSGPLGSRALVYNDESRPTSITYPGGVETFIYNALGQRMRGVLGGAAHRYVYNGERVLEDTTDAGIMQARYTTASGSYFSPLLHFFTGGDWTQRRYPAYDNIGTARLLLRGNGAISDNYVLDTFGRWIASSGTTPNLARSRPPVGGRDRHGGAAGPHLATYRYVGSLGYYATGSSLMHLGARYYMPEVGRFASIDPLHGPVVVSKAGHVTLASPTQYGYANNQPTRFVDPTGRYSGEWPPEVTEDCEILATQCNNAANAEKADCIGRCKPADDYQGCLWKCLLSGPGYPVCVLLCEAGTAGLNSWCAKSCKRAWREEVESCENARCFCLWLLARRERANRPWEPWQ